MREITSPVKKFPGTVVLPDALTWTQYLAWSDAILDARDMNSLHGAHRILIGELAIVEEWKLSGIPEKPTTDNFPTKPIAAVVNVIGWIMEEVTAMVQEADEAPNA